MEQDIIYSRGRKLEKWGESEHETGVTVADVAQFEEIPKGAIILKEMTSDDIYNGSK